jgi:ribosome-associated protein
MKINASITIPDDELDFSFIRSSGPGGQNVNKVSTAVQLRFNVRSTSSLPEAVKARLVRLAGVQINQTGELILTSRRYRTQEQNRLAAEQRFAALVGKALEAPKVRHSTQPSTASRLKRVDAKKRRGTIKRNRQPVDAGE